MNFKKITPISDLIEFCGPLISEVKGDTSLKVKNFTTLETSSTESFVFINNPKRLYKINETKSRCVLLPMSALDKVEVTENQVFLFSYNVDRAAQVIKKEFVFPTPYRSDFAGVHSTAIVHESSLIQEGVTVGPYAVIGKNVEVGKNSFIGSHSTIEDNCQIGENVTIHPQVYVGHSCEIGNQCEIMPQAVIGSEGFGYAHDEKGNHYRIPHTGKVILEDDVHVGAGTAIDRGTIDDSIIGRGTKIDNQVHLAHNTIVGKNGLITAQVVTAGSSQIGDNFICGGKSAITGHIKITDNVNIAGFSGVSNDVKEPGQYGGYPLLPLKQHLKVKASSNHLPEFRKQLNRVLRKLFPEDYQ